jgi:gliding motility-associated-like protein
VDTSVANFDSVKYVWDSLPGPIRIDSAKGIKHEKLKVKNKYTKQYKLSARGACVDSTIFKIITVTVPFIDSLNLNITKSEFDRCANKPIPIDGIISGKTSTVNSNDYSYSWWSRDSGTVFDSNAPKIGTDKNLSYVFSKAGKFAITYKAVDSCLYRPAIKEVIFNIIQCDIPNVFTPDGDGRNDYFAVNFAIGQSAILTVYDRWGKEVYKNANYTCSYNSSGIDPSNNCFTAKDLNDGTYFYALEIPGDKKYQGYVQVVNKK